MSFHVIREAYALELIELWWIATGDNPADTSTNSTDANTFHRHMNRVMKVFHQAEEDLIETTDATKRARKNKKKI